MARLHKAICVTPFRARVRAPPKQPVDLAALSRLELTLREKYAPANQPAVSPEQWARVSTPSSDPVCSLLLDGPITPDEVRAAAACLRNQAAALRTPVLALRRLLLSDETSLTGSYARLFNPLLAGTVDLPIEYTTTALALIPKPNKPINDFRSIGYGCSHSRLLQTIINTRLTALQQYAQPIHRSQCGFMRNIGADMLVWLVCLISELEEIADSPLLHVFLDVRSAFASVRHTDLADLLVLAGVTGKLAALALRYVTNSHVYMSKRGYTCTLIHLTRGLVEGLVFCPPLWNIVLNPYLVDMELALNALHARGLDLAPLIGGMPFVTPAYADDLLILVCSFHAAESCLSRSTPFFARRELQLGIGVDKSAYLSLRGPGPLLGSEPLPATTTYKYLGKQMHARGTISGHLVHCDTMLAKYDAALGHLRASGIRDAKLVFAITAMVTRIRMSFVYALPTWGLYAPAGLTLLEQKDCDLQRVLMRSPRLPAPVVHSTTRLPTLQCMLDRSILGLICRILALPRTNMFRVFLCDIVRRWCTTHDPLLVDTWWPRARERLAAIDAVPLKSSGFNAPYVAPDVLFVPSIEKLCMQADDSDWYKIGCCWVV